MANKQKEALKKFHSNPDKPTSAGSIKIPRALGDTRRKIAALTEPSVELIGSAIRGDFVAEKSVWKGTPSEKQDILNNDPSASFEYVTLDNGKEVEVLIEYVMVNPKRLDLAKWVVQSDIALKKAAEDSKLRKLEAAMKEKKARDEGVLKSSAEEDAERVRRLKSKPRLVLDYDSSEDEDLEEDD